MKKVIKNNYKIIIGVLIGITLSITTVYAVDAYIESNKVAYTNHNKNNIEEAIDELYERSGIHKEKWIDPELNGADPVLQDPLIPVEIKPNGNVYYANENSEWYNYNEKRWANAVILVDNPSNQNYKVGDHILEKDIESYFVWIPRYKYKVWDLGKYTETYTRDKLTEDVNNPDINTAFWKVAGSNSKLIDIVFGDQSHIKAEGTTKQGSGESGGDTSVTIDEYLIHPAFTLGTKDLNGIWVGKFETGYREASNAAEAQVDNIEPQSIIIKPDVYSWREIKVKNIFMTAYGYEAGNSEHNAELDPHMMKNTEWGAVTYLSHSAYGIGNNVNLNNNSEWKTGYGATANADQRAYPGITGTTAEKTKTQPWNTVVGYLASTTGNISGIYDMGGGAWEYMAACVENTVGDSGFDKTTLVKEMEDGYIDKYDSNSTSVSYDKRILGDATGELGPFYYYLEKNTSSNFKSSWYANLAVFSSADVPWLGRGGMINAGSYGGLFWFDNLGGLALNDRGFRLVLSPTN